MLQGSLAAALLAGAWRETPSDSTISARELDEIAPLLLKSGGGGLAWRKIRQSDLRDSPAGNQLLQAYRLHTLQGAVLERKITQLITFLRSAGCEPILGKGWAIARLYPDKGLRPYGDVDLYVHPAQHGRTLAALWEPNTPACPVDLHKGLAELNDRRFDDVYDRSQLVSLGDAQVRILGPEDNLRLLCLHTLRHGAWRPIWLCDVGVALESRSEEFDWDYLLGGSSRRSDWVACAIGLAHQLLGTEVDDTPIARRAKHLPQWLVPTVLRQWGVGQRIPHGDRTRMQSYLLRPAGLIQALRLRWPNAIEATVGVRGPFNGLPRLPFQIGDALLRTAKFLTHVPKALLQQYRVRA